MGCEVLLILNMDEEQASLTWNTDNSTENDTATHLLHLFNNNAFSTIPRNQTPAGRAIILVQENLKISLIKIESLSEVELIKFLDNLTRVPYQISFEEFRKNDMAVQRQYFKDRNIFFECQREHALAWFQDHYTAGQRFIREVKPFQKDRLLGIKNKIENCSVCKNHRQDLGIFRFATEMNPDDCIQFRSYCEFGLKEVDEVAKVMGEEIRLYRAETTAIIKQETENLQNEDKRAKKEEILESRNRRFWDPLTNRPLPNKLADYKYKVAEVTTRLFEDPGLDDLLEKFREREQFVTDHDMVRSENSVPELQPNLSNDDLLNSLYTIETLIKFGSSTSAVQHIRRHSVADPREYVRLANNFIRSFSSDYTTKPTISWCQEGDVRSINFERNNETAAVKEREGVLFLASYYHNSKETP